MPSPRLEVWAIAPVRRSRWTIVADPVKRAQRVEVSLRASAILRERSPRVGLALQAYLHRTAADLDRLLPLGVTIRPVKGAYLEPPAVACARKTDVDERYFTFARRLLSDDALGAGARVQIATHDRRLIDRIGSFIATRVVPSGCYEYAMLYGIQRPLQQRLAQSGAALRVLISYGEHWFPWYMRRLAERPANVWFVLRNLASR